MSILYALAFAALGLTVVLAETSLGIAVGSRYADFSEGPRPRFVTMAGSIIGSVLGIILMVLMSISFVGVLILWSRLGVLWTVTALPLAMLVSGVVGLIFSRAGYVLSIRPVEHVLREISN
jgi:hypothetical protein